MLSSILNPLTLLGSAESRGDDEFFICDSSQDADLYDVIRWEYSPHYSSFVRWIHWLPMDPPHKDPVIQNFDFFFVSPNKMWTNIEIASKLRSHVTRVTLPQPWDVSTQCPMQTNNLPRNFHFQNLIFTSYIGVRLCWTLSAQFLQQRNRGNQITCFITTKANKGCHTDSLQYISIQTSQHVF